MPPRNLAAIVLLVLAASAESLPELRIEPTAGGSVLYVKNVSAQPLTAYLIELVDYPGSAYSLWQDDVSNPLAPGVEKRIPITNMTVGAVPDYVKMRAAIYADGNSAGIPEKIVQIVERRRFTLQTTRELIGRLEKAASAPKATILADLKQWSDSLPPLGRSNRNSQAAINQAAGRSLIADAISQLDTRPAGEVIATLRASEHALAASRPTL